MNDIYILLSYTTFMNENSGCHEIKIKRINKRLTNNRTIKGSSKKGCIAVCKYVRTSMSCREF